MKRRRLAFWATVFCLLFLGACEEEAARKISFADLPGWQEDRVLEARPALLHSCGKHLGDKEWRAPCQAIEKATNEADLREALEKHFQPFSIKSDACGFYTGYYEPVLRGAWKKEKTFQTPLWQKPKDLIGVDLGAFDPALAGRRLVGKIQKGKLIPYDTRAEIAAGSLKNRAEPLLWLENPVDAFFLETQGSGQIEMPDGARAEIGVAAKNGHPYIHIGPDMLKSGAISRPASAQDIKRWLKERPSEAQAVMNKNPSVIFFKEKTEDEKLTPMRSLAVDPEHVPLGAPLWLVTDQRRTLVVAQDTGSAIKGPLRGDLFWGFGDAAEKGASAMQERGTFYLLKPKAAP